MRAAILDRQVTIMKIPVVIMAVALPGILAAQAAVETAVGAGRAATTAAPAQRAGKAIAGAFQNLNHALQSSEKPQSTTRSATNAATIPASRQRTSAVRDKSAADETKAAASFENPVDIQEGMDYAEVVHRFGSPSLKLTTGPGEETVYYAKKNLNVSATVRSGKVTAVQKTGGPDAATGLTIR